MYRPALSDPGDSHIALCILDYLESLFTVANRESFSRAEILVILNSVKNDPEIIDPLAVIAFEQSTGEIEE